MLRRKTQNVQSIDNIGKKTESLGNLQKKLQAQGYNSYEDLEMLNQINKPSKGQIKGEKRRHIDFADNDYLYSNANGANGRSQFFHSPGILNFKKGETSLPFLGLDQKDKQFIK